MKLHYPNDATVMVANNETIDYSSMTVTELKAEAKSKGIAGYSSMTKSELIEALQ